jgi:predicted ferric reductase
MRQSRLSGVESPGFNHWSQTPRLRTIEFGSPNPLIGEFAMIKSSFLHLGEPINGNRVSGNMSLVARRSQGHGNRELEGQGIRWFYKPSWGALLCAVYPVLAIAPLVGLHAIDSDADHSLVTQFGINCAMVGFTLLSLQFILTARLKWIEGPFGLDLILRFHRAMALVIVALLCAHPLLIAGSESWGLLTRLHVHWYFWAGRIALLLLAVQVIAALLRSAMRLSYERWRAGHNVVAMAVLVLGTAHGLMAAGHDLQSAAKLIVWTAAPMLALATWLYTHGIRPLLLARRAFRVTSVKFEGPRVWTVTLDAPAGQPFHFLPGQFQFLRLRGSIVPAEEHPFTIASSPSRPQQISLTIKACGDFTNLIDRIRVGDRATVHGPFGRFSHDLYPDEGHLVFIAGGVGITPLMSMLRAMRDRREARRVTLIYASRELDDILFVPELVAMETGRCPLLNVIYVVSQPPGWWTGETGRVDVFRLNEWCDGLGDKAFYLCCPPQMTTELVHDLRYCHVSPHRIHCDYFAL